MLEILETQAVAKKYPEKENLWNKYLKVRKGTEAVCAPLKIEDHQIQSMPDVSPPKWHLAHTSWFFENFILVSHLPNFQVFHPQFNFLFNSYYKTVGEHHPRSQRGFLSRPILQEILNYRHHVDQKMELLLKGYLNNTISNLVTLGIHHEQQHQELLLTDIKHILYSNPLRPIYQADRFIEKQSTSTSHQWISFPEGLYKIGYSGKGFSFDNERPNHRVFLENFKLGSRLITNGEFLEFIQDKGYQTPKLWLSDGWDTVQQNKWNAPLYWERKEDHWYQFTLSGMQPLQLNNPVRHISFYEANAFAHWSAKRLPTEAEWEVAARNELTAQSSKLTALFNTTWQWTQSPYTPYPGFKPEQGSIGEYNGKFMCNQMVLRGGSCFTPTDHIRPTYRNFFPPQTRWQCTGIRLAEDEC